MVPAGKTKAQNWHADSIIDLRPLAFDVQAFYFAHDTPKEMGPTLILPGSHLRKVNTESIGRYKNIVGQRQLERKPARSSLCITASGTAPSPTLPTGPAMSSSCGCSRARSSGAV